MLGNFLKSGVLRLKTTPVPKDAAPVLIAVDTGFSGGFSLPEEKLSLLKLNPLGYESYVLANRERVHLPVFQGQVMVGEVTYEARFLPGQPLLGVEFMETAFSSLHIDFGAGKMTLE